jgi:hypothetical protein
MTKVYFELLSLSSVFHCSKNARPETERMSILPKREIQQVGEYPLRRQASSQYQFFPPLERHCAWQASHAAGPHFLPDWASCMFFANDTEGAVVRASIASPQIVIGATFFISRSPEVQE